MRNGKWESLLFKAYCTPLYTAHLWRNYKKASLQKMTVAYNDCMRLLLKAPRSCSASQMFVEIGVPTCPAVLRNLMYRFMCRLTDSANSIIVALSNPAKSSVRLSSKLWNHWRSRPLYVYVCLVFLHVYIVLCALMFYMFCGPPCECLE